MYLIYIDESGKPDYSNPEPEFLLAALTINERSWKDIDTQVIQLKKKYFPNKDFLDVEFHATDIFNHTKCFKNIPLQTRLDLFKEIMELIANIDCTINAVIIRKDRLKKDSTDVDMIATEYLFERLCYLLTIENEKIRKSKDDIEYGLLMIDSVNPKYDNKIRTKIRHLFDDGTHYEKNKHIIEDPIFINSSYRHLSQLVDCIAYCIRRKFRANEPSEEMQKLFDNYYGAITNRVDLSYCPIAYPKWAELRVLHVSERFAVPNP